MATGTSLAGPAAHRARDIDFGDLLELAGDTGLTAYDASYLWLARELHAELVTLDRRLAAAAAAI